MYFYGLLLDGGLPLKLNRNQVNYLFAGIPF
jgi:hypothetical protein